MNPFSRGTSRTDFRQGGRCWWLALLLAQAACSGSIADDPPAGSAPVGAQPGRPGGAGGAGGLTGSSPAPAGQPSPDGMNTGGHTGGTNPVPSGNSAPVVCDPKQRALGPRRIWRLNAPQYAKTMAAVLGEAPAPVTSSVPFGSRYPADLFSTRAASYGVLEQDLGVVMTAAADLATRVTGKAKGDCLGKGAFADCAGKWIADRGKAMFRRPLTVEEIARYRGEAVKAAATLGEEEALKATFEAMALSPYFLFRTELGDANGKLTAHEVASALSYSLTDGPPDADLMRAADANALGTPEQVKAQVKRLLADLPNQPKVTAFFDELFQLPEVKSAFKEPKQFPLHDADGLLEDVRAQVRDVLANHGTRNFFQTLLSTRTAIVRGRTLSSYNLPADPTLGPDATRKVMLPDTQRAGLLTHPAFLVAQGQNDDRHPVTLGHTLREVLLCQEIPAIPVGLAPKLPEDPKLTWREKLAQTRGEPCWTCHQQMDPLGLAYQTFDHVGRHRTMEVGKPIDAADKLTGAGSVDGPFRDAVELSLKLSTSPVVQQCLIRQSFRYFMGREETATDGCSLVQADAAYGANGDYLEMVTSLFTAPTFLNRTAQ